MTNIKILIVEDEAIVAMDIRNRLELLGYTIPGIASSGEQAIKMTAETCPDLVLMDIMLGDGIDGIEAAELIHKRTDIPIIFLSAYADEKILSRAKITKPFAYILKPFEERELHYAIEIGIYNHYLETELKESKKWLEAAINSIGDAVLATDNEGMIKLINPYAEALTGWKKDEALNKPLRTVFNIINGETGEKVEDPRTKVLREGTFYGLASNTLLVGKNGKEMPVDIIGSPIKDDRDNIIGLILTFYDIIERKQLEAALKKFARLDSNR
jgi:PAS domain S-box-containing protein